MVPELGPCIFYYAYAIIIMNSENGLMEKKNKILPIGRLSFVFLIFSLISGFLLGANDSLADNTATIDLSIGVPMACTMAGDVASNHTAEIENGIYRTGIGVTIFRVICNDHAGFSVYAIGFSDDTMGNNNLVARVGGELSPSNDIVTGTATSGNTSNWAMMLTPVAGTYAPTILSDNDGSFSSYHAVPSSYQKVVTFASGTDGTNGSAFTSTYATYATSLQPAGTYSGKVKYTMVHPYDGEAPLQPQQPTIGCISYFANASNAVGTMGCQSATDGNTVRLFASNFSREGYGFAGWSDAYDYATNPNANFYGPNEDIVVPTGTIANGLALYAVWVKSAGDFQDAAKTASVCNSLTAASTSGARTLDSVSALTDTRDGQTYAIAKLADNKCWMIENLRLADTHQEGANVVPTTLTTTNTNNPLNDNNSTNPTVTLKHNYSDTDTYPTLSSTSSDATSWCQTDSVACNDQSRLRTDNTASRVSYRATDIMSTSASLYSYGNYYNWYSATAGNGTYSFSTNNNSVGGDLCPAGWKLPIGGRKANVSTSDFWSLSRAVIGADPANFANDYFYYNGNPEGTNAPKLLRTYPNNLLYSGNVTGASIYHRGSSGYYWASTTYNSYYAYDLALHLSNVYPGTDTNYKYLGRTVRCLATQ